MYSNELICNILDYINNHIDTEIKIDDLSNTFYFDRTYIMKKFKKDLNITIVNYINSIKIFNTLLDFNSDDTVLSIALKNGYNSGEYFAETFKKVVGVTPSTYKKFITRENISDDELYTIRESINNIQEIKLKANSYLNRRKPKELKEKKLSLFK